MKKPKGKKHQNKPPRETKSYGNGYSPKEIGIDGDSGEYYSGGYGNPHNC